MVVVGRVKRALEEHRVTNLRFQALVDVESYEPEIEASKHFYAEWRGRNN
jgi:hypothetical protein